ncbi:MAG: glycosyltransferase [Pseudomonadota bacterium]
MDSLRILALTLLICYHTLLVYSTDTWRLKSEYAGHWADYIIALLTPWRMALVFFIAGIAARFMLDKMKPWRFLFDRASKLLVAFVFAVIVIVPFQRYVRLDEDHAYRGGYIHYLLTQSMSVVRADGIWLPDFAHAWFLPFLFVYSAAALVLFTLTPGLVRLAQRGIEKTPPGVLIAVTMLWFAFLERWIQPRYPMTGIITADPSAHLRFAPVFALGLLVAKSAAFQANTAVARGRIWAAAIALAGLSIAVLWASDFMDHLYSARLILRGLYGGMAMFAVYMFGEAALNRRSAALTYATDAVLPVYLMHQTVLVVVGDRLVQQHWPLPLEAVTLFAATALIPLAIYQVFVRETPWLRVLFGLRPRLRVERKAMNDSSPPAPQAPEVAVLIAAFNAQDTLERSVRSALAQPEVTEICIVDDASTDGTLTLARRLAGESARIKIIAQPSNRGPAAARNAAIAATKAPWLTILDADDYLMPGRLDKLHAAQPSADFIADALIRVPQGTEPGEHYEDTRVHTLTFEAFVEGNLGLSKGPLDLGFIKPLMRRTFLERHRLSYQENMRLGEDYELYARALALGARFVLTGPTGYISVERPGSLSRKHGEDDLQHLRDCDDAIARIRPFTRREKAALKRHKTSVDCRLQWRRLITAVKERDVRAAMRTFHSPATALYLTTRLGEQAWLRSIGRGPKSEIEATP